MPPDGTRLLIVDDDVSNRMTLSALLEDEGYSVETAESFEEGADKLATAGPFALVLLDLHLGSHLGTDLIPKIRAANAQSRICLVSGSNSSAEDIPGVDATMAKGEAFDTILARLEQLLRAGE